jgi:hypothetical protein
MLESLFFADNIEFALIRTRFYEARISIKPLPSTSGTFNNQMSFIGNAILAFPINSDNASLLTFSCLFLSLESSNPGILVEDLDAFVGEP